MSCPDCRSENPEAARFCYRCGRALKGAALEADRLERPFVVQPGEGVRQFALVSTIMPHANQEDADNFRWAFLITGAVVIAFAGFGLLPAALLAGAALVPVVYLVYLYDLNIWEEAPVPVVLGLMGLTGLLSAVVSLVFFKWLFAGELLANLSSRVSGPSLFGLVVFALLLPLVAEVAKNVGAVWLASKPAFDDMIDGLTFGVAAGSAYAAVETVIAHSGMLTGDVRVDAGVGTWIVVILNAMIVKAVIYGAATGIAVAAYSGLGEGHDGFTPSYFAHVGLAVLANVAYWLGVNLLGTLPFGQGLGLLWGVVIAAFLILRIRVMLQAALLETALEDAARDRRPAAAVTEGGFCPECEMPLLPDALFCVACGESVRATSGPARHYIREAQSSGGVA